jgi:hypothetical protein
LGSSPAPQRQTADTFQAAATFLELCSIWGPLDPELAGRIKSWLGGLLCYRLIKCLNVGVVDRFFFLLRCRICRAADTFQAAATFLELCSIWGPLDPELAGRIKFAKFHFDRGLSWLGGLLCYRLIKCLNVGVVDRFFFLLRSPKANGRYFPGSSYIP